MRGKRDEKPAASVTMGFVADDALKAEIHAFRDAFPARISVSSACCFLLRKGLDAAKAEKEAAHG